MTENNILKFNFFYKVFVYFVILLLFEGIFHFYYYIISQKIDFIPFKNQTGYNSIIWSENGLVEFLQLIFLLISAIFLVKFIKKTFNNINIILKTFIIMYMLGILYYFMEEISSGQHIFGWQTQEFFSNINSQNETNIHNTSSLFNELPRNLLLIWCSLSFIFVKILKTEFFSLKYIIFPNKNLKFISILILIFFVPDLLVDKLDLAPGHPAANDTEILLNIFFEIISFNFVRLSELQELLFNFYILWHSYYLNKVKLS
jgi:hypothetical protein